MRQYIKLADAVGMTITGVTRSDCSSRLILLGCEHYALLGIHEWFGDCSIDESEWPERSINVNPDHAFKIGLIDEAEFNAIKLAHLAEEAAFIQQNEHLEKEVFLRLKAKFEPQDQTTTEKL